MTGSLIFHFCNLTMVSALQLRCQPAGALLQEAGWSDTVTMTGKQPGWYHLTVWTGHLSERVSISISTNTFRSNNNLTTQNKCSHTKQTTHTQIVLRCFFAHQIFHYFFLRLKSETQLAQKITWEDKMDGDCLQQI